jgi:formate hydrogenlyase subunit 4
MEAVMMQAYSLINIVLALCLAPLFMGVINRTKASFAGRSGRPLLQPYYDVLKLLGKGAVYSRTTTWVFRAGPAVGLAATAVSIALIPCGVLPAPISFQGDLVLFAYLLGLARFMTVVSALDTGSSFEGMGASREVTFSAFAEPVLFLGMIALARHAGSLSLTGIFSLNLPDRLANPAPVMAMVGVSFFIVMLAENARMPVDDPNTHLELTMIHEVMVLDHGGPDLAFIEYGAALKLWAFGALVVNTFVPFWSMDALPGAALFVSCMLLMAVAVGVVESVMARLRLIRVQQFLAAAAALAVFALALGM